MSKAKKEIIIIIPLFQNDFHYLNIILYVMKIKTESCGSRKTLVNLSEMTVSFVANAPVESA